MSAKTRRINQVVVAPLEGRVLLRLGVFRTLKRLGAMAAVLIAGINVSYAQGLGEWHQTLVTSIAQPVTLRVDLAHADLQIVYSREGEVKISVSAQAKPGGAIEENYIAGHIVVEQSGNRIAIRDTFVLDDMGRTVKFNFRIDAPYRTDVESYVAQGNQSIVGVMGPVNARSKRGDIKLSYISTNVHAEAVAGNLELQVI